MTTFLILTAISVSVDSLFCGFSLSTEGKKKFQVILGISFTVFLMCLLTNYFTVFLTKYLSEETASFGGIILIVLGLFNLFFSKTEIKTNKQSVLKQSLLCGFAVGLDGATANLSLALMGINAFYVPLLIAVMHAIMISVGVLLSKLAFRKKAKKFEFIPPLVLICLGVYKLTGLF